MGHFIDFTKNKSFDKVISIGVDPFKEILIYNECELSSMDVYDIDEEFISSGNNYFKSTNLKISYIHSNILNDEIKSNYDTLFLFQMDYIFSDRELLIILNKIKKSGVKNCYVITPSIFNLNRGFIPYVFIEFLSLTHLLLKDFFTKKSNLINSYTTYKRTKTHFIKLFKKSNYVLDSEKTIMNNNGSFNLFHFNSYPNL